MTMPGQKIYIMMTLELIQQVQKLPKVLAFPPLEAKFASQICGVSTEAHNILLKNVNGDEGNWVSELQSISSFLRLFRIPNVITHHSISTIRHETQRATLIPHSTLPRAYPWKHMTYSGLLLNLAQRLMT